MLNSVQNAKKANPLILDDYTIIRNFQEGDKRAFGILVDRYGEKIRNLIYQIISNSILVDDLAQEVFIKVYNSLDQFRFESSFYTWLYKITVNKCRDEIRKRKVRKMVSLDFIFSDSSEISDPVDQYDRIEGDMLINEALSKLSPKQKEIIILKDLNNLSYQEISEILNCEMGTVKSRLARARTELAQVVKKISGINVVKEQKNKTSLSLSR